LDEKTGLAYVNTGNKGPYASACTPGPDLWAAAVLAINDKTGQFVWGFQGVAHDSWDYDCAWNQMLGNETVSGVSTEVLWKTCKAGYLFELNAATGALIWSWTPPTSDIPRCPACYMFDPQNSTQMNLAWPVPMGSNQGTFLSYPSEFGEFENDMAYDPTTNFVVVVAQNVPITVKHIEPNITNYATTNGLQTVGATSTPNDNSTVYAIDGQSGQVAWKAFVPNQGYRGGVTITGGVVYLTLSSGVLEMLNAKTGVKIADKLIGGPLNVLPAVGATKTGQMEIIVPITVGLVTWGTAVPGDIIALGLPVGLTTATSTTTVTGSGSTVTVTSASGGGTTTVTASGGGTTTVTASGGSTVTKTTTVETTATVSSGGNGIDPTIFYAVGGVAAILAVSTGLLAIRGRRR